MSQARPQVLSLYREYLKLVRDWPADKVRPSRDMKQVLAQRVEETFRRPLQNEHESFDIADAQRQLEALKKILNNDFKSEFPLSDKILSPASNPNYYSRLVAVLNATKEGDKKSIISKFFFQR